MEEQRAWPVLDLPGSCRAEPASPAPKAGPRRSLSHPARLVYGRRSGQGCCPEAQTRTGWVLNGRAFVADQADFEGGPPPWCGGVRSEYHAFARMAAAEHFGKIVISSE